MNDCFDHKRRRPSSLKTAAQFMMGMGLAVCRTHVCFDRDRLDISGRADNCDCAVGKARQLDRPAFKIREDDTLCAHIAVNGHHQKPRIDPIEKNRAVLLVKINFGRTIRHARKEDISMTAKHAAPHGAERLKSETISVD